MPPSPKASRVRAPRRALPALARSVAAAASFALLGGLAVPGAAAAQETVTLGFGRLFHNDLIGDGHDRWRTGGYSVAMLRGPVWDGTLPDRPGAILEYRLRSEVIVPAAVIGSPGYRPYVGTISGGVHTHFGLGALEASVGVDVLAMGPQTGVSDFQEGFHDLFGLDGPRGVALQLDDAVHVGGTAELVWPVSLSDGVTFRPFVEAQGGIETLGRVGADVLVGAVASGGLLTRDVVTGHLIRAIEGDASGFAFVAGADWAQVGESAYLPEERGIAAEEARWRARAGVHMQLGPDISALYGMTYLSEEYVGQPEGQFVGSLKVNFNF